MSTAPSTPTLGLSRQLAEVIGAELIDLSTGQVRDDHACWCHACQRAKAVCTALYASRTHDQVRALLHHAVAFRRALWRAYVLACRRPWTSSLDRLMDAAVLDCQRLADELGMPAADKARGLVLREFGERTGQWPFCATGSHPQGCSCPPDEVARDAEQGES